MSVLWRKETGEAVFFQFEIDAAEALSGGHFTSVEPTDAPRAEVGRDDRKTAVIGEKDRLGQPLTAEERTYIAPVQAEADDVSPHGPHSVGAVGAAPEVKDSAPFDPSIASREELVSWMIGRGETVRATTSTLTLRDRAANLLKG